MNVVSNVKIYDLDESLKAAGYPMQTEVILGEVNEKDLARAQRLVNATKTGNTAHHQFMTGIRVNFDLTFTNKAWVEAERYRFLEFVSSQSTMHRITQFDLDEQYIEYVDPQIIEIMKKKINEYNQLIANKPKEDAAEQLKIDYANLCKQKYLELLYSNPAGFKLTARMTTNYRCLRNIYIQRRDHRLPEWQAFCNWIETLPYANELLIN